MKRLTKQIAIELLAYYELTTIEQTLLRRACQVRLNAQAPYSHYWVGCSLITDEDLIFEGCNVENVNWSETVHAEENAISNAVSKLGPFRIKMMAVVGAPENQIIVWPPKKLVTLQSAIQNVGDVCPSCGHCLQIIAENCFGKNGLFDPAIPLLGYQESTGEIYRTTIGDAFPMPFLPQHLGVNYANDSRLKH